MNLTRNLIVVASLGFASMANASGLSLLHEDGTQDTIFLNDLKKITITPSDYDPASFVVNTTNMSIEGVKTIETFDYTSFVKETSSATNIMVYPNPVKDKIIVSGAGSDPKVSIYDVNGVQILKIESSEIEVSSFQPGIYLLNVNGQVIRFIKN